MNLIADVIKAILAVLIVVLVALVVASVTVGIGYLVGTFIAILPVISDCLTYTLPIDKSQIPALTAWASTPLILVSFGFFGIILLGANGKAGANDNADA